MNRTMQRGAFFVTLLLGLLLIVVPAFAQELWCPTPPPCLPDQPCPMMPECFPRVPGVSTNPEWLKINYHRVDAEISDQIARTTVDMEWVNEGNQLAEGTFVFPIPMGAAVEELIMYINGTPIEARILEADEARSIYDAIVRQYRDPALLEYIGSQLVQANVFPIPPGETRRITITYSQVLEVDNGLIRYNYPLDVTRLTSRRPVESMSVRVSVEGQDPISNIYSPSHNIAISRDDDNHGFRAGFEQNFFVPDQDFVLYYGLENETINVNVLTYREGANEDGYFMLLVQPPLNDENVQVVPRDIIIVLDQSGSMEGPKWDQARAAASYVLDNLNEQDRFNVILFSTGWRTFSDEMVDAADADEAAEWVSSQYAEGGTDINGALTTALDMVGERPTTILFMTDGLPTEGVTDVQSILENIEAAAPSNVRIFTFGVGDDVDTVLLDTIVRDHRGYASYVRPNERVDEEVASLYNKISAPVLTDLELEIDGVRFESLYPSVPLPDLFAGTQLTVVGRYRDGADDAVVRLSGMVNGERQTFTYDQIDFRDRAGGDSYVARLWATRRIGELLNQIRLNGENPEIVDSIVSLSIRFGIITPYTSFLIEEDDILSQTARAEAAGRLADEAEAAFADSSGAMAVQAAESFQQMQAAPQMAAMPTMVPSGGGGGVPVDPNTGMMGGFTATPAGTSMPGDAEGQAPFIPAESPIQTVDGKTFILQGDVWTDTTFEPDTMTTTKVTFLGDDYFDLLAQIPELAVYFAVGERVIVVYEGVAYEVITEVG